MKPFSIVSSRLFQSKRLKITFEGTVVKPKRLPTDTLLWGERGTFIASCACERDSFAEIWTSVFCRFALLTCAPSVLSSVHSSISCLPPTVLRLPLKRFAVSESTSVACIWQQKKLQKVEFQFSQKILLFSFSANSPCSLAHWANYHQYSHTSLRVQQCF